MRKIIAVMMAIAFVFTAFGMTRNVYAEEIVGVDAITKQAFI